MAKDPIDNENIDDEPLDENEDRDDEDEQDNDSEAPDLSTTTVGDESDLENSLFAEEEKERRKRDILEKYRTKMSDMRDIEKMTSTTKWHDIQSWLKSEEIKQTATLKTSDKTREFVHAQKAVRILPSIIELARTPVEEFAAFIASAPEYARAEMPYKVAWDEEDSTIIFSEIVTLAPEEAEV